jgi:lactate dehydrogenase-like 2-hydroxyacid dehydrogenase
MCIILSLLKRIYGLSQLSKYKNVHVCGNFSLQLSKRLADSDLAVIGLTGIGPIRKISVLDWFLPY